jgi:hypothetical protein
LALKTPDFTPIKETTPSETVPKVPKIIKVASVPDIGVSNIS